jgi:hypothetical protein
MVHQQLFFTSGEGLRKIAVENNMDFSVILDPKYSSNTIYAIKHK